MAFIKNLKYKDLTVKLPEVITITENDVNAELERFRASQAETVELTDDTIELKNGDTACIYFCGYVDGEKFPGGEADKYDLVIGSHTFIPGFEDQMVGMKIGEERDVLVTFPEVYEPSLAGKDATFKVKLYSVKQLKEVELTDELVKKATNLDGIEAFKAGYRAYMQDKLSQEYFAKKRDLLLTTIVNNAEVEVTKDMIDAQIDTMLSDLERELVNYNMTVDQYFEMNGTSKDAEIERVRAQVKENIKKVLVVEEIMNLENISASDEEVEEFLKDTKAENIDKAGVKMNLSYAKVLEFLDANNNWEK